MGEYRHILRRLGGRFVMALPVLIAGVYFLITSEAFGPLLSLPFFLIVGVLIGPTLCELLAEPWCGFFYPVKRFDRPQPMYGQPAAKRARGLYEEAMADYEKIAAAYPEEIQPYLSMIEIAVVELKDPERARVLLSRGLAAFPAESNRAALRQVYYANLTRLAPHPEWQEELASRPLATKKISEGTVVNEPDGLTHRRFHAGGYNRPV